MKDDEEGGSREVDVGMVALTPNPNMTRDLESNPGMLPWSANGNQTVRYGCNLLRSHPAGQEASRP